MVVIFRSLYIVPLLFISGHAQLLFQNTFFKFPDPFSRFRHEPRGSATEREDTNSSSGSSGAGYDGQWELVSENSGVSAMHAILLPKINKVLMYDATIWKISKIPLPPQKMPCRIVDRTTGELDCWCHSVLFDIETSKLKALKVHIILSEN